MKKTKSKVEQKAAKNAAFKVAILGFGTVGSSVARILSRRAIPGLQLTHVFNRNVHRKKVDWLPSVEWTGDFKDILASDANLVVEVVGGLKPAGEWGPDLSAHERVMLDNIFAGGGTETRLSSLKNRFYTAIPVIKQDIFSALRSKGMYWLDPQSAAGYSFLGISVSAARPVTAKRIVVTQIRGACSCCPCPFRVCSSWLSGCAASGAAGVRSAGLRSSVM